MSTAAGANKARSSRILIMAADVVPLVAEPRRMYVSVEHGSTSLKSGKVGGHDMRPVGTLALLGLREEQTHGTCRNSNLKRED